jgi:hypothetical protein
MIDFKKQKDSIVNYITLNYPTIINDYNTEAILIINEPTITTEYLDFDRFKKDFCLFVELDTLNFNTTKFDDDCEKAEIAIYNFYLVLRGDTVSNLDEKLMNASSLFYELMKEVDIESVKQSTIRSVDFFKYIEGSNNIVASKFIVEIIKGI